MFYPGTSPLPRSGVARYSEGANLPQVSVRDDRQNSKQWIKNELVARQADILAAGVNRLSQNFAKLRRYKTPVIQSFENYFPFKIYQPSNIANFIGQTAPMFTNNLAGSPTPCTITASNIPTNLAAMPPTVSVADTWRFFAVRSGLVEFRPIYNFLGFVADSGPGTSYGLAPFDPNNWGTKFGSGQTSQYSIANLDGVGFWESKTGFDDQTAISQNVPCVIGITPTGSNFVSVALWIQIDPDSVSSIYPTIALFGNAQTNNSSLPESSFYPGPLAIPIGEVWISSDLSQFVPYQEVFDHITNRYPPGNGNFIGNGNQLNSPVGTVANIRGTWAVAYDGVDLPTPTILPSDLSSQLFYPGDEIIFFDELGALPPFHVPWQGRYIFIGSSPAFISDPNFGPHNDSNWFQLMASAYPT